MTIQTKSSNPSVNNRKGIVVTPDGNYSMPYFIFEAFNRSRLTAFRYKWKTFMEMCRKHQPDIFKLIKKEKPFEDSGMIIKSIIFDELA